MKTLSALLISTLAINANAQSFDTNAVKAPKYQTDCYATERPNVAICIEQVTLKPCSVINDTNHAHEISKRAKSIRGYVYLNGSFFEVGPDDNQHTYNIHSKDGVTWVPGDCG